MECSTCLMRREVCCPLFPFVTPNAQAGGLGGILKSGAEFFGRRLPPSYYVEPVTGVLILVPLLLTIVLIGRFLRVGEIRKEFRCLAFTMLLAALIVFAFDCCIFGPTMRYEMDYLPPLILVVGILVLWIDQKKAGFLGG